ncbi:protein DESIGUAL 2-like [Cornus florida]|uniref:protein DESIGUAL 2-like n=1 Tax=Cornus florida TaxID=4283 RepID=UPI00289F808E|nr:protein DESIGUAL 2-like [Cornus florida]
MAKQIGLLICLLIIVLDVVAGVLGIEAEVAQNNVKHLRLWIFECKDSSHQAFKLGLAAAVLLALAHANANLFGGCICIWIILAVGLSMLGGTLENSRSRKSCGLSHHRVLSKGGILCFLHGLFSVAYCVYATAIGDDEKRNPQGTHV